VAAVRRRASRRLPKPILDFVEGGADDEVTVERNVEAFRQAVLVPRHGTGVRSARLARTVLGGELAVPVLFAPCGGLPMVAPDGDLMATRAAGRAGTTFVLSAFSGTPVEEVVAASSGPVWFQTYLTGGRSGTEELLHRVRSAGCSGLMVTFDSTVSGNRERDVRHHLYQAAALEPRGLLQVAPHVIRHWPWLAAFRSSGLRPGVANVPGAGRGTVPTAEVAALQQATPPTWADLGWLRTVWDGPLVAKGILTVEDARRAADAGADGIVVSNHGGRQLDRAPATLSVLPRIVAAVGGDVEVLVDGGIRRGSDVAVALAAGARAVLIGRPYVYGLAAGDVAGAARVVEILVAELARTLVLLGAESLDDLDASFSPVDAQRSRTGPQ